MALQKNKIYRAELTGYTAEGAAVARIDGMAVLDRKSTRLNSSH